MDRPVHESLLRAYDAAGDAGGACDAAAAFCRAFPRDLRLKKDLGRRLVALGRDAGAERAFTDLAEAEPHAAEGHRALAEIRESQRRYDDAAVQWRQVVRVRTLEPEGWLRLAGALAQAGKREEARRTLSEVMDREWEERFGDVKQRAARMLGSLDCRSLAEAALTRFSLDARHGRSLCSAGPGSGAERRTRMSGGERPGGLTALAVVAFIWGPIGGLNALMSLVVFALGATRQPMLEGVPPAALFATSGFSVILAGLLIVAGIGYLLRKRILGRLTGNIYAVGAILNNAVLFSVGIKFQFLALFGLLVPVLTLVLLNTSFRHDFVN